MTEMNQTLDRENAVKELAARIAGRQDYIVTVPPDAVPKVARQLDSIPDWSAYIDNGTPLILWAAQAPTLVAAHLLLPVAVVVVIPKSVPASALEGIAGREVPADGSQDLLVLGMEEKPYMLPMIFVEALEIVDPPYAKILREHGARYDSEISDLILICDACHLPIASRDGCLWIDNDEVLRTQQGQKEWRDQHVVKEGPFAGSFEASALAEMPGEVSWRAHHADCDPEPNANAYCIESESIRTWAQLLDWTAHLMEKSWLPLTDWDEVLRGVVGGSHRVVAKSGADK